ncbi:hypothetical protein [Fimbriiglobus ruber]|nr:hypothetical protein [Fimbriiglobus ruber]
MTNSMHLLAVAATSEQPLAGLSVAMLRTPSPQRGRPSSNCCATSPPPPLRRSHPVASFAPEQQLRDCLREMGRFGLLWADNHIDPEGVGAWPSHLVFESVPSTQLGRKTPQA